MAVRAQLLDRERPAGLLDTVRRLTLLQVDPTAAIAPNAELVAWSRLGSGLDRTEVARCLAERTLIELRAMIRPAEDLALYRAEMAATAVGDVAPAGARASASGCSTTTPAGATSSLDSTPLDRCRHVSFLTRACVRGSRRAGRTTAT